VIVSAFAFVGHNFFEKNKPAVLDYPWLSFQSDLRVYKETLMGKRPF